ncbi:MAG: hypothetical protein A2287_07400 [Candidatus Melainabacteria bacterium RIFOXYA12_FULL_32_12]|nr:MAG: hypothetical protein A2104_04160 [Candidatus Melainabacteria bacterium GWF2_32_7]OGI18106.1 MAG: hypothetical protein A2255_00390 [Candidatus Melainabacteria bacterium RIFOXYA2_FULL_32_9]OGI29257.1 MAG: hypothetical protein A2287_07400 [Candidatus Melainabacteria bacterium RIFOXYA12_FULL_32_12]
MQIISHRGYWKTLEEKNTEIAFRRSFEMGFGTETDIRDIAGTLVISHDPPKGSEMPFDRFLQIYSEYDKSLYLALNIKSDGLQNELKRLINKYNIQNYFVFDMSIPDTIGYINQGLNVFSRSSEYEKDLPFYGKSTGVWMDCFNSDCITNDKIEYHLNNSKQVCIVSSELHKREHILAWKQYKKLNTQNIMLCTDYPQQAKEFFNGPN